MQTKNDARKVQRSRMGDEDVNKLSETCNYFTRLVYLMIKIAFICCRSLVLYILPRKYKDISSDIILITGGGRGIGRQLALEIAKHKPQHIVLWGRGLSHLQTTANDIKQLGIPCSFMSCDISEKEQIYAKAQEIQDTIGVVSILINNAGIVNGRKIIDSNDEEIEANFTVNTLAHIWMLKAFLPGMIDKRSGHIVTMSSVLGMMGMAGLSDYCSSKFATTGLAESVYWELDEFPNIFITTVHPYLVANKMFSSMKLRFPRLIPALSEKYVAERTVQAVLTNSSYIIMPRIMYLIVLAQKIFPLSALLPVYKFLGTDTAMDNFISSSKTKKS